MNVASLELSRELEELSGWDDTEKFHFRDSLWTARELRGRTMTDDNRAVPAYSLGYLVRKLPFSTTCSGPNEGTYAAWLALKANETFQEANTPEDALCKLAIELFKQGVLKREAGDERA